MSLAGPTWSIGPTVISGAMYAGVPPMVVVAEMLSDLRNSGVASAMPQSMSSTSPNSPSITFSGLMSRCTTPRECAKPTASATFIQISRFSDNDFWSMTLIHGVPCTHFIE